MKTQPHPVARFVCATILVVTALAVAGCSAEKKNWTGPKKPAKVTTEPWQYGDHAGRILRTSHYLIHTTIADDDVLERLPQVMEGAHAQYEAFVPVAPTTRPMDCYVFSGRKQWERFTTENTGRDAKDYLLIKRGAYAYGDRFVAYYIGDNETYSTAAHEGWHQYVGRHFKGRLPPFLEEGTASLFENVKFRGDLPRWDLSLNPTRALGVRKAIENGALWPLEDLVSMDALDVVSLPWARIEAFYSQGWAFARFLREYNDGQYREGFRRLLADAAAGVAFDSASGQVRRPNGPLKRSGIQPMLEHYLGKPLTEVEKEYRPFLQTIAYDQLNNQWFSDPR